MTRSHQLLIAFVIAFCPFAASAQVTTGTPPFGSFGGGPDIINLANVNAHLNIPVLYRPGRGTNFTYDLSYDSSVWYPVTSGSTTTWQPVSNWGWRGNTEVTTGYLSYSLKSLKESCFDSYLKRTIYYYITVAQSYSYHDAWGVPHPFLATSSDGGSSSDGACTTDPWSITGGVAQDGSGYSLTTSGTTFQSLYSSTGSNINPPLNTGTGSGSFTDRNGNLLSVSSGGVFTDTQGTTALTVSGSGTVASSLVFTYTPPNASSSKCVSTNTVGVACYAMNYTNYTVATNFGISGINENKSSAAVPLVTSIVLPDGSQYSFSYEPTPPVPASGTCTPYSGTTCVTARVTKVTLPTGGSITYSYTGGNNGILPDGSTATLTRATPDTAGGSPWIYVHSESGTAWTTLITDPQGNQTNMDFQGIYETYRQVYQGSSSSGTLLWADTICYNGNGSNCQTTPVTLPIRQRRTNPQFGGTEIQAFHTSFYDSFGNLTEQDDYDWANGIPTTILRKTLVTFASLGNITAFRKTVTVCNGTGSSPSCNNTGTVVSQTNYNYDETGVVAPTNQPTPQHTTVSGSRGNLTSINYPVGNLKAIFTYFDTGNPQTSKDVNGGTTTFNYGTLAATCGNAFPTGIIEAISTLTQSYTWNCTGGVPATTNDENNQVTTYTWNDPDFWRPTNVKFADGGETDWTYNSQTSVITTTKMNSSQNIVATQLLDGLGRNKEQQLNSDPEGAVYQDTTYDSIGRLYTVSNPYRSTSDPTYGLTTYGYDALSRTKSVTLPDGSVAGTSYSNNTSTATDPAGKKRQSTIDSLGRLTQVLEDPSGANYETDYGYDASGNTLCVAQKGTNTGTFSACSSIPSSWRPRIFAYDALSRLTSETNPESGTTTYGYDASGHFGDRTSRLAPAPNQTGSSTVTTTYAYDLLHRLTQKSYSDITTPTASYYYDLATPWGSPYGGSYKGRLNEADTVDSTGHYVASTIFVYDPMGRVTTNGLCTAVNCNVVGFHTSFSYDLAGDLTSYRTAENGISFTSQYDTAARPTTLTSSLVDANHPATLAAVNWYTPSAFPEYTTFGNNLMEVLEQNKALQICRFNLNTGPLPSSLPQHCSDNLNAPTIQDFYLTYNEGTANNGNVAMWQGTSGQTFHRNFGYDSLNRPSTMSDSWTNSACQALSWTFDAWGNRTDQSVTGGTCPTFHQTVNSQNRLANSPYQYDAAGNLIADGNHSYSYDAENRLASVDSGSTAKYSYDALGQRVYKAVGSAITQYVHNLNGQVILETDGNGNGTPTADYMYLAGNLAAEYKNDTTYFVHQDHLGSTRLVTALNQSVVQNLDYLPFGELNSSDSGSTTHKFTGDEHDSETNLEHTWFRQYSSSMGRWMTPDPAGLAAVDQTNPQSWNRYGYVTNNPLSLVDPTGLYVVCMGGITFDEVDFFVDGQYDSSDYTLIGDQCGGRGGGLVGGGGGGERGGGARTPFLPSLTPSQLQSLQDKKKQCAAAQAKVASLRQNAQALNVDKLLKDNLRAVGAGALIGCAIGALSTEAVTTGGGFIFGGVPGAAVGAVGGVPMAVGDCAVGAIGVAMTEEAVFTLTHLGEIADSTSIGVHAIIADAEVAVACQP
jgi:RHS repeat-associated protein